MPLYVSVSGILQGLKFFNRRPITIASTPLNAKPLRLSQYLPHYTSNTLPRESNCPGTYTRIA